MILFNGGGNHAGNADVLAREMRVLLVERADANLLAAKMAELTHLSPVESRSLCDAGRAWIESKFNLDRTAAAYDELYREMLTP